MFLKGQIQKLHKQFLIAILFLWVAIGPLHLIGHDRDHRNGSCEICFQLNHLGIDSIDSELEIIPAFYEAERISHQHHISVLYSIATFYYLRGPPI